MIGLSVLQYYPQFDYLKPEENRELCILTCANAMMRNSFSIQYQESSEELYNEWCLNLAAGSINRGDWIYRVMEVEKMSNPELVNVAIYKYMLFRLVNFIHGEKIEPKDKKLIQKHSVTNKNISSIYFHLYKRYYSKLSDDAKSTIHNLNIPSSWNILDMYNNFMEYAFVPNEYVRCHPDFWIDHQQQLYPAEITSQYAKVAWYNDPASSLIIENEDTTDDESMASYNIMVEEAFRFMGLEDEYYSYEEDDED